MPYKKPTKQFIEMEWLLKGRGLNAPALAKVLGCGETAARQKLNEPWRFTLKDLEAIHRVGHITDEDLKGAIKWH